MSEAEFMAVLAEHKKGTDWIKVGGFVLGAAALVSGIGAIGAAAGAAVGGGLLGGAANTAVTQMGSDLAVGAARGLPVSESRAKALLAEWRHVGPIPETYAEHKRMHVDAQRAHAWGIQSQEALKRRYEEAAQRVNALLPLSHPSAHVPHWVWQALGALLCWILGSGAQTYAMRYWQSDAIALLAAAPLFMWALFLLFKGWTGRKALSWSKGSQQPLLSFHPRYNSRSP